MRSMSVRPASGSIATTRPCRLTWRYQLLSSTVSETRGSLRRWSRRLRPSSMFTSTRPSSHRYQVATLNGAPSGLRVAITAGWGSRRSAWSSSGRGGLGIAAVVSVGVAGRVLGVPGLRLEAQQQRGEDAVALDEDSAVLPGPVVVL